MIERVWLIADAPTGDISYFRQGAEGDEPNWRLTGPITYTSQKTAEAAAKNPSFLPSGVTGNFIATPVDTTDFVRAIFNGFPPSQTDVFMLDNNVYPLTKRGADWIDEALDAPIWSPLFDESHWHGALDWLNRVLEQVAGALGMTMETVNAIGHINAENEDESAADVAQVGALIQKNVRIAVVPEPGTIALESDARSHDLTPDAQFWLHTMGMGSFGLPELEIRNVPAQWVSAAGAELNGWAAYSLDQGLSEGDLVEGGGPVPLQYQARASTNEFWQAKGVQCLRMDVVAVRFLVSAKSHGPEAIH